MKPWTLPGAVYFPQQTVTFRPGRLMGVLRKNLAEMGVEFPAGITCVNDWHALREGRIEIHSRQLGGEDFEA